MWHTSFLQLPISLGSLDPAVAHQFACSALRILGRRRRLPWTTEAESYWPKQLKEYAEAVTNVHPCGLDGEGLADAVGQRVKAGHPSGFRVDPNEMRIALIDKPQIWRCGWCRTKHLHPSAGVCITCYRQLPAAPEPSYAAKEDYYAWLADQDGGAYRFHCEELTGQTDPLEAQARQARFQGCLPSRDGGKENRRDRHSFGHDDDGGRCRHRRPARRRHGEHASPALQLSAARRACRATKRTSCHCADVCRGAGAMTSSTLPTRRRSPVMPPQPFLDMRSEPILTRAFTAEVLTRAFRSVAAQLAFDGGRSVHGEFGSAHDWLNYEGLADAVRGTLAAGRDTWVAIARSLLAATRIDPATAAKLADWAADELVDRITLVAQGARVPALSEALAQAGLLPMFGFPTQVRVLYTDRPKNWEEPNTLDRDSGIAISEFAPGFERSSTSQCTPPSGSSPTCSGPDGSWQESP